MNLFSTVEVFDNDRYCQQAKDFLQQLYQQRHRELTPDFPVETWITHLTQQVDNILIGLYQRTIGQDPNTALIAIGGYGRGELFPKSDIDLLILTTAKSDKEAITEFVQHLWQLGLDIAQSVRTAKECLQDAKQDPDMLTSLLEARLIAGNEEHFDAINIIQPPLIPRRAFLEIKLDEQRIRDASQIGKLEPNIKTGSGGLRDIQMIYWINRYCLAYNTPNPYDLTELLTPAENEELLDSRKTLWQIRFALHLCTKQQKDRLSFEQQKQLAHLLGHTENRTNQAIEQFMRGYYLATLRIRRLNRLAIKLIDATMRPQSECKNLDKDFALINHRLTLKNPTALNDHPELVWRIFLHLLNNPLIDSLSPQLGRQLRENRNHLFSPSNPDREHQSHQAFLQILNHTGDIYRQIRRMHRYGILSRYIPDFAHVIGLMQYDLFHEYTVDQHTLRLIYFLDQFKTFQPDYPKAQEIMSTLRHPAILYLAALFHDIGKGRGGHHSEVGEQLVMQYLARNRVIDYRDGELLKFLVRNHLILSTTAQKKDLSDPDVIAEFAAQIPDSEHLDYLYLLTLADISATNSTLWNSWRANLMYSLYQQTHNYLNTLITSPEQQIETLKHHALEQLTEDPVTIIELWQNLPKEFFYHETPTAIAIKTRALLNNPNENIVLHLQNQPPRLFISASSSPDILFARTTHFMEKNDLAIVEARLYNDHSRKRTYQQYTLSDTRSFDTTLLKQLTLIIAGNVPPKPLGARLSVTPLKHFSTDTIIQTKEDKPNKRTIMEITCKDRHGLLSLISRVLLEHRIHLAHAKIATLGERVEDSFYLSDQEGNALTPETIQKLTDTLYIVLGGEVEQH